MKSKKLKLGLIVFAIGAIGVLSLLTLNFNLPPETAALLSHLSDTQIKWLSLINPSVLLLISVIIGSLLYIRTELRLPIIERLAGYREGKIAYKTIFLFGFAGGIVAGLVISVINILFQPFIFDELKQLSASISPGILVRFLYGGLTEEILLRFGLMTFLVWLFNTLFSSVPKLSYWLAIAISSLLFAVGHLPAVYSAVGSPNVVLISYILIGNTLGGLIFGWLYWKKGLESAFVAHIITHVVMLTMGSFMI